MPTTREVRDRLRRASRLCPPRRAHGTPRPRTWAHKRPGRAPPDFSSPPRYAWRSSRHRRHVNESTELYELRALSCSALYTQIARCASRTALRVDSATPSSASTAYLALSPACSSSIVASQPLPSPANLIALPAFFANSRTTASNTGDAALSASVVSRALSMDD